MASSSAHEAGPSTAPAHPSSNSSSIKSQHGDEAVLTYDVLDEKDAIAFVADDGAGATVLFSGTTRDSFRGEQLYFAQKNFVTGTDHLIHLTMCVRVLQVNG